MTGRMLLAGLTTLAALACGGGGSDSGVPTGNNGGGGDITVGNNLFNPNTFSVAPKTPVTWTWNSNGVEHNVTFDDGEASPTQGSGTYSRVFTAEGNYAYHCTIHGASMSGKITVGSGSGGSGSGSGGGGGGGGGGGYGGG